MKVRIITLLLLTTLLVVSCQFSQPKEQPTIPDDMAYPAPPMLGDANSLYPAYATGSYITWNQAREMIFNGEVTQISVTQTLLTALSLKDGRTLLAQQAAPGELQKLLDECGEICKDIDILYE